MAELSTILPAERIVNIRDPHGNETGITVTLMSIDDDRMKRIKRQIQDEKIRLNNRNKDFKAEDVEENSRNLIFNAMTGWNWGLDADGEQNTFRGKVPGFTKPEVFEVFTTLSWFQQQLVEEISDTKSFFQK